jgi:hypothetical protein
MRYDSFLGHACHSFAAKGNLSVTFSGISQANNQTTTFIDLWSLENVGANLGASAEEWQTSRI